MNVASISPRCTWIDSDVYRFRTDIVSACVDFESIRIFNFAPILHRIASIRTDIISYMLRSLTDVASISHRFASLRISLASISHSCGAICLDSACIPHQYRRSSHRFALISHRFTSIDIGFTLIAHRFALLRIDAHRRLVVSYRF